ncbi:hypothetical protein DRJ17_04230 [Candidatus Woesearchaeota archaeon]|nr:MAG: hypothetical protein DRJ17_04230 [Candidatus Woesearchaeota archaeon]
MTITSEKKFITGIIGENPSTYSKSRIMWNFCFAVLGIDAEYIPWDINKEELEEFIKELTKNKKVRGFNITNPYKVEAAKFFKDSLDDAAKAIGGINTVVMRNGVKAYSTDGYGAITCITEKSINVEGKHLLVIGAGGAGVAVAVEAVKQGAKVSVANRTHKKAVDLQTRIKQFLGQNINAIPLYEDSNLSTEFNDAFRNADIIVNTVDYEKKKGEPLFPESMYKNLTGNVVFMDAVYGHKSFILEFADKYGHIAIPGENMLVHQAVLGFHYMFDTEVETVEKLMKYAIKRFEFNAANKEIEDEAARYKSGSA